MQRETAVALATLIILVSFVFVYRANRVPQASFEKIRSSPSLTKRRTGPRSLLLSEASKTEFPSPRVNPSSASSAFLRNERSGRLRSRGESPYPGDSICDLIWTANQESEQPGAAESLMNALDPAGNSEDVALFRMLLQSGGEKVRDADRELRSESAREISLLARLGVVGFATPNVAGPQTSIDPSDFSRVEKMSELDPSNAFWPLLKYRLLRDQGVPEAVRTDWLLEAAQSREYRDPLQSFYQALQSQTLDDPRKFAAYSLLATQTPALSKDPIFDLHIPVSQDSRVNSAVNELRGKIKITQNRAQDNALFTEASDPSACDEERVLQFYQTKVKEAETGVSNSQSSPSPLPRN
ncbi:MAG: hypothetical protein H7301_04665 [Cryobacterium sp.]|nr:hypothetical protein [Oligoflexia bacterium]